MKVKITIIGFILIMSILGCKNENDQPNASNKYLISYSNVSSWFGNTIKVTINKDGLLQISEKKELDNYQRDSEYQIDGSEFSSLKENLNSIAKTTMNKQYGFADNKPTDLPIIYFSYNFEGKSDSTQIYFPEQNELPKELELLVSNIKNLIIKHDTVFNKKSGILAGQTSGDNISYKVFTPEFTKLDQGIDLDKDGINDIHFHVYSRFDHFYRIIQMSVLGLNDKTWISAETESDAKGHKVGDSISAQLNWKKGGLTLDGQTSYENLGSFRYGDGYLCFKIENQDVIYGWIRIGASASLLSLDNFAAYQYAFVRRNKNE